MISASESKDVLLIRIVPNCSATWRQTRLVVFALGGLTLAIALFWSLMGAWLILPFAGLEVGLLAFLLYQVCLETYHQQVLYIRDDSIELEYGKDFPKKRWLFDRKSSEVEITNAAHSLSPPEVVLRDLHREVSLGERLNQQDKESLIEKLKLAGLRYRIRGRNTTVAIDGFDLS